jgi:flagellar biosynthesis chaperone FliJ
MKPRTLARLDMLAAAQETQALEAVRRHNATLHQAVEHRGLLAAYRARLAQSWQDGAVLPAAQARRAGQFSAATHSAEGQIDQAASLAATQLESAITKLGQVKAQRHALAEALRKAAQLAARETEQRAERDRPWRPNPARPRS